MTWIPCSMCGQAPCQCSVSPWLRPSVPFQFVPITTTTTLPSMAAQSRLSDADVDRIAKRVVELLDERDAKTFAALEQADAEAKFERDERERESREQAEYSRRYAILRNDGVRHDEGEG